MNKGIVRKLDDLGRITLPKEMRTSMKLKEGDPVEMYFNNGVLCLEPYIEKKRIDLSSFTEDELKAELLKRKELAL